MFIGLQKVRDRGACGSYHRVAWAGRQIAVALCTSFFHHYLNIGFIQCQDSVHYLFPGIVDIQVHVVLRSFDGKAAVVGSGIVHGTCEEHDCGACEWLAVGVQYVSFYDTVLGYSDVIVTDLPLHHFDGIVGGLPLPPERQRLFHN